MKNLSFFIVFTFLLTGCASTQVSYEGTIPGEMSKVKATYGWFRSEPPGTDIRVNNIALDTQIQQAVDKHLKSKGYKRVESDQADYLITWFGSIKEEVKEIAVSQYYSSYGYGALAGRVSQMSQNGTVRKTFSRGTLILDVLDPESKKVLWRGSATNTIKENMSETELAKYLDISVKNIFKTLPRR